MLQFAEKWLQKREMRKLVRACLGNKEKAERLIKYEFGKMKWLTKRQATKMAFDRLEKDRSR